MFWLNARKRLNMSGKDYVEHSSYHTCHWWATLMNFHYLACNPAGVAYVPYANMGIPITLNKSELKCKLHCELNEIVSVLA